MFRARRILKVIAKATAEEWRAGLDWYAQAHSIARELEPIDPALAAGVIAALSPNTSWAGNVELARGAYERGYAVGTYGANCAKANAILDGSPPLQVLGGNKVRAFFQCIADPRGQHGAVCVDRHAVDIALGQVCADPVERQRFLERKGVYQSCAEAYRRAAAQLGILPHQAQAIAWVVWRNLKKEGQGIVNLRAARPVHGEVMQ